MSPAAPATERIPERDDDTQSRRRRLDPLADAFLGHLTGQSDRAEQRHQELVGAIREQGAQLSGLRAEIAQVRALIPTHLDARKAQWALIGVIVILIMLLAEARGLDGAGALRTTVEVLTPP